MRLDEKIDRLFALMERMVTQPAPPVNVHVHLDGQRGADDPRAKLAAMKKKDAPLSSPQTQQPDDWSPGGHPRPYTS